MTVFIRRRDAYSKTLNVCVPFISRAKQNREIKGANVNCRQKIVRNCHTILNYMVLGRQNKGAKISLHIKSPTFRAAKLKGFTVFRSTLGQVAL